MSPEVSLLHRLRVQGTVTIEAPDVAQLVVDRGWAVQKKERLALTPTGRAAANAEFRIPEREAVYLTELKDRFDPMNRQLLKLCHDWQVRPGNVVNDHRDSTYDWSVVDRLVAFDAQAGSLIRHLGTTVERLAPYKERLRAARRRVEDGEQDWFASPRIDSYHTVWMQMHEDLLLAIGGDRSTEPPPEQ